MQAGVFQGDGQSQSGAAGGAGARGVGAPEAVEDAGGFAGFQSDTVVAYGDGDGAARGGQFDDDIAAFAVFDGVDDEVAQDAFEASGVGFGDDGLVVAGDEDAAAFVLGEWLGAFDDAADDVAQVDRFRFEGCGAGVEAADFEEVAEQGLEAVELVSEEFGGAGSDRVEVASGLVDDVGGHADGGERGAQLVGDVGDEAALHPGEVLQLLDLVLEVLRHLVERFAEAGDVVFAGDLHAFLEAAGGEAFGDARAMRTGVTTCRTTSQAMAPRRPTTKSPAVAMVVLTRVREASSWVKGKR